MKSLSKYAVLRSLVLVAIMVAGLLAGPVSALAASPGEFELEAAEQPFLGTVVTSAVTAPILIGGIMYIPGEVGGSVTPFLGTVETNAVTSPILIGGILYVPPAQ